MADECELRDNKDEPMVLGQFYYLRESERNLPGYMRYFLVTDLTPGREFMEASYGGKVELTDRLARDLMQADYESILVQRDEMKEAAETYTRWSERIPAKVREEWEEACEEEG